MIGAKAKVAIRKQINSANSLSFVLINAQKTSEATFNGFLLLHLSNFLFVVLSLNKPILAVYICEAKKNA